MKIRMNRQGYATVVLDAAGNEAANNQENITTEGTTLEDGVSVNGEAAMETENAVNGEVTSAEGEGLTGSETEDIPGDVAGEMTEDVSGDVAGEMTEDVSGDAAGEMTEDMTGDMSEGMSDDLMGDMSYADMEGMTDGGMGMDTGAQTKGSVMSSWVFVIGISAVTLALSVVIGILLAKKRIKKGFDLYED